MKGMLKENSLEDKVILVTGGGSGLGKSMVKYFLELGANVIITSRREQLLNDVANEFNAQYSSEVFPIACDVRKIDEVEKVIEESYNKGVSKINIITGKGSRSKVNDDPYKSANFGILKYSEYH